MLKIESISKSYGGVHALRNISFTVDQGDRVAIIGPNGAGKTTLLHIACGKIKPTSGKVFLYEQDITSLPSYKRVMLGLSQSFQITSLLMRLTVLENVLIAINGTASTFPRLIKPIHQDDQLTQKAEYLLKSWDLWDLRDERITNISYGEQRKLEIILSLSSYPKLLLLDEPNSGLTKTESDDIVGRIELISSNLSLIIVAHDLDLVFKIASRILVLFNGELIADGTPEEIQSNPFVQEIYLDQSKRQ